MRLHLYRERLTRELQGLPEYREQEIQSYVLTTAILARRIDDRLGGRLQSEVVEPRFGSRIDFRRLLGLLIHYVRFQPDLFSMTHSDSAAVPEECFFRVYSERIKSKHDAGSRLTIRLADYFAIVEKIARDVFVLRHLLKATTTRLMHVSGAGGEVDEDVLGEVVASIDDVIWLLRQSVDTLTFALREVSLRTRDIKFRTTGPATKDVGEYLAGGGLYGTVGSLVDGYEEEWRYTPFSPGKIGRQGYCFFIEIPDPNLRPMALPFYELARAFGKLRARLPSS